MVSEIQASRLLQRLGSLVPLLIGSNSDKEGCIDVTGATLDPSGYATSVHTISGR
jgi:hypothetical protein